MNQYVLFTIIIVLLFAVVQFYLFITTTSECKKWSYIITNGKKYTGKLIKINNTYARFGNKYEIFVVIEKEDGKTILRNWPHLPSSPYVVGTEVEVYYCTNYPSEFVFADERVGKIRVLNPVQNGKINKKIFWARFILIWIVALIVILIGHQL